MQAHEHAKQQQQLAVERALDEMRSQCEEEKRIAMESAKAAVQISALQHAEELDALSVEVKRDSHQPHLQDVCALLIDLRLRCIA